MTNESDARTTRPSIADYLSPTAKETGPLVVASAGTGSSHVFTAARLLAARLDTSPVVVAVNDPLPVFVPGGAPELVVSPELYEVQRTRLRSDVERALRSEEGGDPTWPVEIVEGQPARAIAEVSRKWGARMIVMGIGRHAPIDRLMGGELALQVIRLADRPVLAVAPGFAELPRHAVVAVDFSAASVRAATEALALLPDGGKLTLAHVQSTPLPVGTVGGEGLRTIYGEGVGMLLDRLVQRLEQSLGGRTIEIEKLVLEGQPADAVLSHAANVGADLIAVGSSGAGFFERLVVGSVATRVVRRSPVTVLAVPRPSATMVERIERELAGEPPETVETTEEERWPALLEEFTERNAGRSTRLEVDDPDIGAQLLQSGYTLVGASYDRKDRRLAIMLRAPGESAAHVTHTVGGVTSVAVLSGRDRHDLALQARHGAGQTILMLQG